MTPGEFWSAYGAPGSVDWCEPNYVHSPFVAEWWNALSSLLIVGIAFAGVRHARRVAGCVEPRFLFLFGSLAVIGLGSAAFHTTLLRSAQALDELPMFFATLLGIHAIHLRAQPAEVTGADLARRIRWVRTVLLAFAAVFLLIYFTTRIHALFLVAYAAGLICAAGLTLKLAFQDGSPAFRRLSLTAAGFFALGFLGLWVPEHVWLSCDHPLQSLELHSLYHLSAGLGAYSWMMALVTDHAERRGAPHLATRERLVEERSPASDRAIESS